MGADQQGLDEAVARLCATDSGVSALADRFDREVPGRAAFERGADILRHGRPILEVANDDLIESGLSDLWKSRLAAPGVREVLRRVIPAVGRIELESHSNLTWLGTGWLITEDLIVTTKFVVGEFAVQRGNGFVFKRGWPNQQNSMSVRIDFKRESRPTNPRPFAVREVSCVGDDPDLRVALVLLEPFGPYGLLPSPLKLADRSPRPGQIVATVGYPRHDSRTSPLVRSIFGDIFEAKRVAPGQIIGVDGPIVRHDCTTAAGMIGAPIVDLETGDVVGLHRGGSFGGTFGLTVAAVAAQLDALRRAGPRSFVVTPPEPITVPSAPPLAPNDLVTALLGAFGFGDLVRLTALELKIDLNELAPRGSTEDAVRVLVAWAQQQNRIGDLFAAAATLRPNNPRLAAPAPQTLPEPVPSANKQRQRLRGLLLDQFPKKVDLALLLDDALGEDLDNVAGGGDEVEIRYALVKWLWVDLRGRLRPLLEEAVAARPNSTELRSLLTALFSSDPSVPTR